MCVTVVTCSHSFAAALETFGFSFTVVVTYSNSSAVCVALETFGFSFTAVDVSLFDPDALYGNDVSDIASDQKSMQSRCFVEMVRFELMTPCLQGRCSPN